MKDLILISEITLNLKTFYYEKKKKKFGGEF